MHFCGMAHRKKDLEEEAYGLYMNTDLTQAQIAQRVGINQKTMSEWVRKGDWAVQKAANNVTRKKVIVGYLMQLQKLREVIDARPEHPYPTASEADTITKITKAIKSLERGLTLSDYITALEELTKFGMKINDKAMREAMPILKEFIQVKAKELAKS